MNEDYLWDKTGRDPEIEALENALKAFRYEQKAPPALPAQVLPFRKRRPRTPLRFGLAAAACLAVLITSLALWLRLAHRGDETAASNNAAPAEQRKAAAPEPPPREHQALRASSDGRAPRAAKPGIVTIDKAAENAPRRKRLTKKNVDAIPAIELTAEEEYAYRQLMLALTITSSKLKIVKDKIDGVEEQAVVLANEK